MAKDGMHTPAVAVGLGFEKEPKQPHGPRLRGKQPLVHSHHKSPVRKIVPGKRASSKSSI
jgi:hypothetical protein